MNIVSTPIPGLVRSPFCVQTYEWLARHNGVEMCPEYGMPLPKWGPVLRISDVLETTHRDPSWDWPRRAGHEHSCRRRSASHDCSDSGS